MVDENVIPPEPDCMAVVDVVFVDPMVNDFTAPPVPMFNVVFDASVEIPMVLVPEFMEMPPEPDCNVKADVDVLSPTVNVVPAVCLRVAERISVVYITFHL